MKNLDSIKNRIEYCFSLGRARACADVKPPYMRRSGSKVRMPMIPQLASILPRVRLMRCRPAAVTTELRQPRRATLAASLPPFPESGNLSGCHLSKSSGPHSAASHTADSKRQNCSLCFAHETSCAASDTKYEKNHGISQSSAIGSLLFHRSARVGTKPESSECEPSTGLLWNP
jgi:hypothetical protein